MSDPTKVMLCDDSSTMRRLVKTVLDREACWQIVYEAIDGQDAIDNLESSAPDIVVMDVEMPVMNGINATSEIRKKRPELPVVIFSSGTCREADATRAALAAGANDSALKPAAVGHIDNALAQLETDLIPKMKKLVSPSNEIIAQESKRFSDVLDMTSPKPLTAN